MNVISSQVDPVFSISHAGVLFQLHFLPARPFDSSRFTDCFAPRRKFSLVALETMARSLVELDLYNPTTLNYTSSPAIATDGLSSSPRLWAAVHIGYLAICDTLLVSLTLAFSVGRSPLGVFPTRHSKQISELSPLFSGPLNGHMANKLPLWAHSQHGALHTAGLPPCHAQHVHHLAPQHRTSPPRAAAETFLFFLFPPRPRHCRRPACRRSHVPPHDTFFFQFSFSQATLKLCTFTVQLCNR